MIEVFRQREAEHAAQADRHVGIPGKIEIELEGEREHTHPGGERGGVPGVLHTADEKGKRVGKEDLLEQALAETGKAGGEAFQRLAAVGDLGPDIAVARNGAGGHMREKREIGGKPKQIPLRLRLLFVNIHRIGNALKRIK